MRKIVFVALLTVYVSGLAFAGDPFVIYPDRFSQDPTDLLDWGQLGGDLTGYATPQYLLTFNGNPVLVGNTSGAPFLRLDEGAHWFGNFDYGETLVYTGSGAGIFGPGPFGIVLSVPVATFGFSIQPDDEAPFTATVLAYDSFGNVLFGNVFSGDGTGQMENGSATFIGMGDLAGANIGAISISTDSGPGNSAYANDFAIDDVTLGVPEPGSLGMAGGALLAMAGLIRRKYRK